MLLRSSHEGEDVPVDDGEADIEKEDSEQRGHHATIAPTKLRPDNATREDVVGLLFLLL